ncbi:MAG: hypothetical protein AAGI70_12655 [Pseudomonadota bacterium]
MTTLTLTAPVATPAPRLTLPALPAAKPAWRDRLGNLILALAGAHAV